MNNSMPRCLWCSFLFFSQLDSIEQLWLAKVVVTRCDELLVFPFVQKTRVLGSRLSSGRIRFVAQGGSELLVGMAHADWASGCLVDFDDPAPRVAARHRKESKSRLSGLASLTFDLPDFVNFLKMLICFFMFLFVES